MVSQFNKCNAADSPLTARGSANHRSMEGMEHQPYKIPFPGTGAQEHVHSCVRSALYEESMKGFQMNLHICVGISGSSPCVFLIMCSRSSVYIYFSLFACLFTHVCTYVCIYALCSVLYAWSCAFAINKHHFALASLRWNSYLCISLSSFLV